MIGWRTARDRYGADIAKRWIEYGEGEHCPACNENARAGAIDLEAEFPSGAFSAPGHPHCVCDTVAEVRKPADMSVAPTSLEKGFNPDEPRDDHGRWEEEIAKGQAAMERALGTYRDVPDAMEVPGVGKVHFIWGEPEDPMKAFRGGYGLAHIVAKHGREVARKIPAMLIRGKRYDRRDDKIEFRHQGHHAVLTHAGHGPDSPWVLTAYKENKSR